MRETLPALLCANFEYNVPALQHPAFREAPS